jgi:predicted amidohydrolase YtcJ
MILALFLFTFSACNGEEPIDAVEVDPGSSDSGDSGDSGSEAVTSGADMVVKGTIYTADENDSVVAAVAITDGKYVYVGDADGVGQFIGDNTEIVETGDGMAMPSFVEAHAHGHEGGIGFLFEVNLYEATTVEEYQTAVRLFIEEHPEREFIIGGGWINGYFPNNAPTAAMLDEVSSDIPIALVSGDHHSYWVNSKAMELMGVNKDTADIPGGVIERDANGNPSGCFREAAQSLVVSVIPQYTVEELKQGILLYQEEVKSYGITAYFEPMINIEGRDNLLAAYEELEAEGLLEIRVFAGWQVLDGDTFIEDVEHVAKLMEETKGGFFQIQTIKLFIDGVVEGHTAYLLEDYADDPGNREEPLWDQGHLNEMVAKADSLGVQVHAHAIGDAATRMVVDAVAFAHEQNGDTGLRHAITHLQVVDPADIIRMGELGIVANVQSYWFCKEPGYFNEVEVPYLGEERANNEYPMKAFFDAGCVVVVSSDFPVTIPSMPLHAIQTGVTRIDGRTGNPESLQNPDQRVSVYQMMKAATWNGAYAYFAENEFGSVEVGKSADFIVLSENIMEIDPMGIGEAFVLKTVLQGATIFE